MQLPEVGDAADVQNCTTVLLTSQNAYFDTIGLGWDVQGVSSLTISSTDLTVPSESFGGTHSGFWQPGFTEDLPLIGFYGSHRDERTDIGSLGYIKFDTQKCGTYSNPKQIPETENGEDEANTEEDQAET